MSWLWLWVLDWSRGFLSGRSYRQTGYHKSFSNLNLTDLLQTEQKKEGRVAFQKRLVFGLKVKYTSQIDIDYL